MVRKKKKSKPLNEARSRADHGTPEALKQADGVQYETVDGGRLGSVKRAYISRQTPMDRYRARGLVSQRQYDAAHAFYVLFDKTRQAGRVTSNYDRIIVDGGGSGSGINEYACSYYVKLQPALGVDHVSVVRAVVVECESANSWAKRHRLPSRMGIERLRDGLDKLANVMGIS